MQTRIIPQDVAAEFETAERCHIVELGNDADDEAVSIARARVEPGITTAWHKLTDTSERYLIISGRGRVEVGDLAATEVQAGDLVRIPADTRQRIANIGDRDLVFYAICSPRFRQSCYNSLE